MECIDLKCTGKLIEIESIGNVQRNRVTLRNGPIPSQAYLSMNKKNTAKVKDK